MWWVTWRQHRAQLLVTAGLLAALGVMLLIDGLSTARITADLAGQADLVPIVHDRFAAMFGVIGWLPLAPALVGLFWGAPVLAREFERGTHRLAWTQSVSPRRWLAVKLGLLSALVLLAGLAFGAMISTWMSAYPPMARDDRFANQGVFVLTGVVPAAWWLFAFWVGVAAGAACRRTMPAVAVTLALVLTPILAMFFYNVRAYYAPPERAVIEPNSGPGDMVPTDWLVVELEHPGPDGRQVVYYQPADRYWRFQWTEAGLLAAATVVLGGVTVHRANRSRI